MLLQPVQSGDVLVIQRGEELGLSFEAGEPLLILRHRLGQHLDRHISIQPLVLASIDFTHPTSADLLDDAVMPERATDEVLHCLWLPARQWYLKTAVG